MITCFVRYHLIRGKLAEFEKYARLWMRLIHRFGGTHHGFFVPGKSPPSAEFSYSDIAETGPDNVAVALLTFPDAAAYDSYRRQAETDPEAVAATAHYSKERCFSRYERTFMTPVASAADCKDW